MAVVRVPKTPKSSFDKDRRASALLLDQIKHLEWAALPASQRKPKQLKKYRQVKTETQAAERIKQLTAIIRHNKEQELAGPPPKPGGVQAKVVLPPLPPAAKSTKARTKAKRAPVRKNPTKTTRARKARMGRKGR